MHDKEIELKDVVHTCIKDIEIRSYLKKTVNCGLYNHIITHLVYSSEFTAIEQTLLRQNSTPLILHIRLCIIIIYVRQVQSIGLIARI